MVQYAKLGDLGEIFIGLTYKPENVASEGTIVLRSSNIQDGELDFNDIVRVNCMVRENLFVKPNDILMCSRNGSAKLVGKCTLLPTMSEPVTFGAFMTIIRTPYNGYLRHFFDSAAFRNQIKGSATTTINQITRKMLDDVLVPIFDDKTQNQISEQFSSIDRLISLRKQQLAKLDELVKARFVELFGDLHSTNFPKCKMRDVCGIKHGYAFSGEFFTEEDNNILLVTPGNFKVGGGFQEKKCKFFTGEYSKEYVLNGGDLIVTMTDLSKNMDTLGYSAIVPCTDRVYLHNQRIGLFVDLSEKIKRVFLMYFMQTTEYRDSIIASATGSTVHHTSPSKILDCDVFVPPIELQNQFAAFVKQNDKSKLAIQQSLDKLETLKKSLMQKYFG